MDDPNLVDRLIRTLEPHFDLYQEVWLREPLFGFDSRIDVLAIPKEPLAERFPFAMLGVEIKNDSYKIGHRTQAFKQCIDYRRCVINDRRLPSRRSLWVPCVALYRGRDAPTHLGDHYDDGELVRLAGKFNVGVLEHHHYNGLELRVCEERIWSTRWGVSDAKTTWPDTRLVANSTRRRP